MRFFCLFSYISLTLVCLLMPYIYLLGFLSSCLSVCLSIYLFIYLPILAVPGLSCGMHAGSSSPTRDQTRASCIGSAALPTGPPGRSHPWVSFDVKYKRATDAQMELPCSCAPTLPEWASLKLSEILSVTWLPSPLLPLILCVASFSWFL